MYNYPKFFYLEFLNFTSAKVFGVIWSGLGVIYWMYSAVFFLKYFKPGTCFNKGWYESGYLVAILRIIL
jgi:hypothetical protein